MAPKKSDVLWSHYWQTPGQNPLGKPVQSAKKRADDVEADVVSRKLHLHARLERWLKVSCKWVTSCYVPTVLEQYLLESLVGSTKPKLEASNTSQTCTTRFLRYLGGLSFFQQ